VAKKKTAADPATATPPPGSAPGPNGRRPKTVCPLTQGEFTAKAQPISVLVDGQSKLVGDVKMFSTGSFGWFANGKVEVEVDGKPVKCQANVVITAIGSKDADRGF
jgi:hypothetical protein